MRKRLWTEDEDKILESLYPRHGARAVRRRLDRTTKAIHRRAQVLGVMYGVTERNRTIGEVALEACLDRSTVLKAAKADGVLQLYGRGGGKPIGVVPNAWANAYVQQRRGWREEGVAEAYVTINEAARSCGVHRSTLRRWLRGRPTGGPYFASVRTRLQSDQNGLRLYLNPSDVWCALEAWRRDGHEFGKPGPKVSVRK